MRLLWDFPEERQPTLVAILLSKYGKLVGCTTSPHSRIFTFDWGPQSFPRYVVAKGIYVSDSAPSGEKRKRLSNAMYEANTAYAVCHHPCIHRFFEIEIVYGVPFFLSRGRDATLRDVITAGAMPVCEVASIAIQILHGLNYCASRGLLCHQDLKPENVFVDYIRRHYNTPDDYPLRHRVLIADFELANAYRALGRPFGSRPYQAPEQYRPPGAHEPHADFSRVDVFAVGVILFEMLTGGMHPIGTRTSLIWPLPAAGESRKWLRETPWKQWIERGANLSINDEKELDPDVLEIIRSCLRVDSANRISATDLEVRLLKRLEQMDERAHRALSAMLEQFDKDAREGEKGGWPHYAERLKQLNEAFPDS